MPMRLDEGWNQIQFNLSDFTRRAYGTNYVETTRVQIHANCRIRRIYFSDRLYSEEELPPEFKLFIPTREDPNRATETSASSHQVASPGHTEEPLEQIFIEEVTNETTVPVEIENAMEAVINESSQQAVAVSSP